MEASVDLNIAPYRRPAGLPFHAITIEHIWAKLTSLTLRQRQAIRQRIYLYTTEHKHGFILGSSRPSWDASRHSWRGSRALLLPHIHFQQHPNEPAPQSTPFQTGLATTVTQHLVRHAAVINSGTTTMQMYMMGARSIGRANARLGVSVDIMLACMFERLVLQSSGYPA
jgi:hypothetical protein